MNNKLVNGLLVLVFAVIAPLAIVTASTYGATAMPENQAFTLYNMGVEHTEKGEWDLAREDFDQAIESDPEFPEAYHNRGWAKYEMGLFDQAIDDFTMAIDLGIDSPEVTYTNRGISYLDQGNILQATLDINEALKVNPDYAEAHFIRGLFYADMGAREQGIAELEMAVDLGLEQEAREIAEAVLASLKTE